MSNRRVTRLGAVRTLTCLEAGEEGFSFVKLCSGCDYYLQNRPLNAIAMKKCRSSLSKYWQCTTPHSFGQLTSSDPYPAVKRNKYNSYLLIDRGSNNGGQSSSKKVRIDSACQQPNQCVLDQLPIQRPRVITFKEYSKALSEKDSALAERDHIVAKMTDISAESARQHEQAQKEASLAEEYIATLIIERDVALQERDLTVAEKERNLRRISELSHEVATLRQQIDDLVRRLRQTEELMPVYVEQQNQLTERDNALELQQRRSQSKSSIYIGSKGSPLLYLKKLTTKIYPELNNKQQLTSLFDEMYSKKKAFCTYVKQRVKEEMLPSLIMDVYRDIKKEFAPWKFLEVLDNSKQSLNQVSFFLFPTFYLIV
jgi:hypothetical protein